MIYDSRCTGTSRCSRWNFMRWIGLFVIVLINEIWKQDYPSSASYTVLAIVYIGSETYDIVPVSSRATFLNNNQYKVRLQFLYNEPNLCNKTNIIVVDDYYTTGTYLTNTTTTVATNASNTTAIYRKPSPIRTYYNNVFYYDEEYVPVALLAVNDGECNLLKMMKNAEAIHGSVDVLFVSGTDPYAYYPEEFNYDYFDSRLLILSITNQTGKAFLKHLNRANESITKQGGPIITFDAVGTTYDYPVFATYPPGYNPNYYNEDDSDDNKTFKFIVVTVVIGAILLTVSILVKRANLLHTTNNNVSSTATQNSNNTRTAPLPTRTETSQPEQPQQQRPARHLLTETEVQQFLSTVAPSRVSTYQNNATITTSNNSTFGKLPSLARMPLSKLDGKAADNKDDEDYCSICLMEIKCCNNENDNKSSGNIDNDDINNNANAERDSTRDLSIARLPCLHVFHMKCIVPWLTQRQGQCPLCKFDVAEYITNPDMNPNFSFAAATVVDDTNEVLTDPLPPTTSITPGNLVERDYEV